MTLQERLAAAQEYSVRLYLQLTALEMQRQQIVAQQAQLSQALVKSDGTVETLTAQIAEESK